MAAVTCNGIPRQILCSRSGHISPQEFSSLTEHVDTFLRQGFFLNVTTIAGDTMWLLGCNLRRDLYILFSVKRIFVTVDRIFIDLCNPRRHKNIWKGPYFIQTRGPWHNLWQIMSFSTLTFCARVWYIANMLRYKVVSGENVIGGPGPGRRSLLTPDWTNRKLECPDQRRHQREDRRVTLYVS